MKVDNHKPAYILRKGVIEKVTVISVGETFTHCISKLGIPVDYLTRHLHGSFEACMAAEQKTLDEQLAAARVRYEEAQRNHKERSDALRRQTNEQT